MRQLLGSKSLCSFVCAGVALLVGPTVESWAAPVQLVVNGEFESPVVAGTHQLFDASLVPGWSTEAGDQMIEIWSQAAHGSPANGFDGSGTGQQIELAANVANVWHSQVVQMPRAARVDLSFDHWARVGGDNITWEVRGSESGVIASGIASPPTGSWGRQTNTVLKTNPEEEVTLRFKTNNSAHLDQVSLGAYREVTGDTLLINETFTAQLPTAPSASPRWFESDPSPTTFEIYNSGGAGARAVSSTYDHDNDPATPQVNLVGAIEVNDGAGQVTLTAELTLPSTLAASVDGELSFFAAYRLPGAGQATPTVSVFNVTDNRSILDPTNVLFNSTASVWEFNDLLVDFIEADAGDLIQVRFFGGGSNGANGLEMTDLVFAVATVPEPGTLALLGLGTVALGVVVRRQRRKQHESLGQL